MFVKGCSIDFSEYMECETNVVFLPHVFSGVSSQKMDSTPQSQEYYNWCGSSGRPWNGYPQDSPQHLVHHVLAHGYSHVDPQVPIISEQLGY